jgi:hypothetical protein
MGKETEKPAPRQKDRSVTSRFFEGLAQDFVVICLELNLDPRTIRKLGSRMAWAVQDRMDATVETPESKKVGAIVLGHTKNELSPYLVFSAGASRAVDEVDPRPEHIQGELIMSADHAGGFTDGVVIPGGFYSKLTRDGFFICDGEGREWESHAELASRIGVWPEEDA